MFSFKITHKNIFPFYFVNRRVRCLQSPSLTLRNSRLNLLQSLFLRNFTNAKDVETKHKVKSVILESSKVFKKKLVTSLRELVQNKFMDISKNQKNSDIPPIPYWKKMKNFFIIIVQLLGISILTDFLFALIVNMISEYRINSVLENGTRPMPKVKKNKFVPRPQISATLNRIFQPDEDHSNYYVICGESGSGKTTLTTVEATNIGKGVIYVDIPPDFENLGKAFGKAINLSFFEDTSVVSLLMRKYFNVTNNTSISLLQWKRVMEIFRDASVVYKAKHGKPLVIVYDNINRLVKENPKVLDILQDDAKDGADGMKYVAVFITSEGSVLRRMQLRSSWSRAEDPIKIGNLTKEESLDYLIKKCNIDATKAKKLYNLIGGQILELKAAVKKLLKGKSFEDIKKQMYIKINGNLKKANLHENYKYHEIGKRVFSALLNSKELKCIEFEKFFNKPEEANEVLEKNIFSYHSESDTVTFQSCTIKCFIQDNARKFIVCDGECNFNQDANEMDFDAMPAIGINVILTGITTQVNNWYLMNKTTSINQNARSTIVLLVGVINYLPPVYDSTTKLQKLPSKFILKPRWKHFSSGQMSYLE
ncbi:hypothetical protein Glove_508g5 [Diversispora epigaea]|uniref:AAA+ ATPase domain-containing protein n=1 Tax=Diversispora epigaea TaxID=1348612 RepID=A0A397GLK1_9GLOM|nr:hypothetical protein Glove_508g5 [Diversispora epigaea]